MSSSNARNPEVLELARLTGRSPSAISYRLGNFHGTSNPGSGFKPVRGEALALFTAMDRDPSERERLAREARSRLSSGVPARPIQLEPAAAALVDAERMMTAETEATLPATTKRIIRKEAQLVRRYIAWLDPDASRLKGVLIPCGSCTLRADLYDRKRNLLIEAKAESSREHIRYAIGQLLDYQRSIAPQPNLAVLLPCAPSNEMLDLLHGLSIMVIYEDDHRFVDTAI
jgi:hypothetical protein